jgi:hypothetical protein
MAKKPHRDKPLATMYQCFSLSRSAYKAGIINTCPRRAAAKVIAELMNKEHRATKGDYRARLQMVRRDVQALAWNRIRTDIPEFRINY